MTSESPMLDLLIVGGLTVDHLPDGSTTAGGTVMHAAGAIAARGLRIGIVTAAGAEPEAQAGLAELRRAAQVVACRPLDHSVTFRHVETVAGRTLWLERIGGSVEVNADLRHRVHPRAVLFGPVLEEVPVAALDAWDEAVATGAILQGWLRSGDEGAEVRPRPLAALGSAVLDALASLDLLVASREDLVAEAEAPREQLAALRRAFGARPDLIVTDGADGLWHDPALDGPGSRHWAVPRPVELTSTVGAGDILAALLTTTLRDAEGGSGAWITEAMRAVADTLQARSR